MTNEQQRHRPWHELRVLRLCSHLTHADIAEQLGTHPSLVSMWERGVRKPNARYVALAANVLNVSADLLGADAVETDEFKETAESLARRAYEIASTGYAETLINEARAAA